MDQMRALSSATNCLTDYIESLHKRIDLTRTYEPEQLIALEFIQAFPEEYAIQGEYSPVRTRASISFDGGQIHGLLLCYDASTLEELVEPLRWLSSRLGPYTINEYPELQRRSYIFSKGRFTFAAFFGNMSSVKSVCKYVQTGVKEEPVYEFKCE
jgi:hypothetical protein